VNTQRLKEVNAGHFLARHRGKMPPWASIVVLKSTAGSAADGRISVSSLIGRDAAAYMLIFSMCGVSNLFAQQSSVPSIDRQLDALFNVGCDLNKPPSVSGEYALKRAKASGATLTDEGWCWWMTAAKAENAEAQTRVGWLLYEERPELSVSYFDQAAMNGWLPARLALSEAYTYGIGVTQNAQLAEQWRLSAVQRWTKLPSAPVPVAKSSDSGREWTTAQKAAAGLLIGILAVAVIGSASSASSSSSSGSSSSYRDNADDRIRRDVEIRRLQQLDQSERWDRHWAEVDQRKREDAR
jgi:hypothetical protein